MIFGLLLPYESCKFERFSLGSVQLRLEIGILENCFFPNIFRNTGFEMKTDMFNWAKLEVLWIEEIIVENISFFREKPEFRRTSPSFSFFSSLSTLKSHLRWPFSKKLSFCFYYIFTFISGFFDFGRKSRVKPTSFIANASKQKEIFTVELWSLKSHQLWRLYRSRG